jgi:sugar phosphate isomerase/epimerase
LLQSGGPANPANALIGVNIIVNTAENKFRSLKNQYPFRVGTTSFIYPADYITNVRYLAPYVDEIELLVFESHPKSLPSKKTIADLARLGNDLDITYNIHLPLDINLAASEKDNRLKAISLLLGAMERVTPLDAVTHTLHLDYREKDHRPDTVSAWQARMQQQVHHVIKTGPLDANRISIETLDYPPAYFSPIVKDLGLAVCLDIGHLIRYGYDVGEIIAVYGALTDIIHLHGVINGKDHLSTHLLNPAIVQTLLLFLSRYTQSLSLEVFNPRHLSNSLEWLGNTIPQSMNKRIEP